MAQNDQWLTDKYWHTPHNFAPEVRDQFTLPDRVYIHDVTLREAMQSPRVCLKPEEKIRIAKALGELGVDTIENGAYMSEAEKEITKELVKMQRKGELKTTVTALAHWVESDVDIALETGVDKITISQTSDPWTVNKLYGLNEKELVERMVRVISYAKKNGLTVSAELYYTYRAPMEFLEYLFKSVVYEAGCDQICISDTRGFALPWTVTHMVRQVKKWIPGIPIEHHGHNDFGLATAMMTSAVVGGAEIIHTSINGIGERVGNAATEEVAMAVELLLGVPTGIKLEKIYPVCELVAELTKHPIARNKPIVGENMFLLSSGQVAWRHWKLDPMRHVQVAFAPELIGAKDFEVILGYGCGKTIVQHKLEKMGIDATDEQIVEIARRVKEEAIMLKWSLTDVQFEQIVNSVLC